MESKGERMSNGYIVAYTFWCLPWAIGLAETCYFGWNLKPSCTAEMMWDAGTAMMAFGGLAGIVVYR